MSRAPAGDPLFLRERGCCRRDFLRGVGLLGAALAGVRLSSVRAAQSTHEGRPTFRSDSTQILIPFTAVDRHEKFVTTLRRDDVRLTDEGREQPIEFLSLEEGPASILFVVDISGSMKKPLAGVQEAMLRVLRISSEDDEFAMVEFAGAPQLTVDFTAKQDLIEERVRTMRPTGGTSLVDAMVLSFRHIAQAHRSRKAIIVVSDGQDNHSRHVTSEAMRLAGESEARVYGIELYPPAGDGFVDRTFLERLTRATGGRYFPTVQREKIPEILDGIDIHQSYVLGFHPPSDRRDGRFHHIDLGLRNRSVRMGVRLFWKERYRVPLYP